MKMIFSGGSSFTHKGTKSIKLELYELGYKWDNVYTLLAGSEITGKDKRGKAYTWTATTNIVRKATCALVRKYKPVSGILTITHENKTKVIDFGNGDCDNEVTVTISGKTKRSRW